MGLKYLLKIGLIRNLIPKFDNIVIVGAMANNILNYKGNPIGKSLKEENCKSIINEIFEKAVKNSCLINYPEDVVVGKSMDDKAIIKELSEVSNDDLILDIGPKTIKKIKDIIERSETILWNGPVGYFENQTSQMVVMKLQKKSLKKIKRIKFILLLEEEIQ